MADPVEVRVVHLTATSDGDLLLDGFTGTDDEKLTKAIAAVQAGSPRRAIRLSARPHTFRQTRATFSGLRILGPNVGWQNPEIAGTNGALPQCVVNLEIPNGGFWLVGGATTYNVTVAGICFKTLNSSCFYQHSFSAGTAYATHLADLAFYGFRHVLGTPADPFSMTLNTWGGVWTHVAVQGEQFSLRGSDNWLTPLSMNYGWAGASGGKYLIRLSNLSKTTLANLYLTARGGQRAVLVEGPASHQGALVLKNFIVEGQNLNDPAMGALVVVKGGGVTLRDTGLNFGMARPSDYTDQTDTGLVMVSGGRALVDGVWYNRANVPGTSTPVAETVPLVAVSGGVAHVKNAFGMGSWSGLPRVARTGGQLVSDASVQLLP